jgi:hypothetical protein
MAGVQKNGGGTRAIISVLIPVFAAIAAIASAVASWYQVQIGRNQLELAKQKFSEIEVHSILTQHRSRVQIQLDSRALRSREPLETADFVARIRNGSGEELLDFFLSLRLRFQHTGTGEYEEREIASHFESAIFPGPLSIRFNLGTPARAAIADYKSRPLTSHSPRSVVLYAEWRLKSGHRIDLTTGYPLARGRK